MSKRRAPFGGLRDHPDLQLEHDRMYELRPESVKTFVEDTSIRLPRFQRKPTWGPRKSFNLALSLFRGYPLGLVVIKRDSDAGRIRKFLLDGRQRRDALIGMRE